MEMKSRVVVSAVIRRDDRILLGRKTDGRGPYPDTWHLPGGGIDLDSESPEQAIRREVKEETGLELDTIEPLVFDSDVEPDKHGVPTRYVFLVFRCSAMKEDVRPGDDLVELRWFPVSELTDLDLPSPSIKLFRTLGAIP